MTTLKVGMYIQHDASNSTRYKAIGVVIHADRDAKPKPRIVVCWISGGDLRFGTTSVVEYKSLWLENNVKVIAEPVNDSPTLAYKEQFNKAAGAIAEGPYHLVTRSGTVIPGVHESLTMAKTEAERLVKEQKIVLKVVAVVGTVKPKIITTIDAEWN